MKTLKEIYNGKSDKGTVHSYIELYEDILAPYRKAKKVLEIGIFAGHSLRMWEEYFSEAEVYGVDLCDQPHGGLADLRPMIAEGTHKIILMDATNPDHIKKHFEGQKFGVIIEDANHNLADQIRIFNNLRPHFNGIYIIEDIADIDKDRIVFEKMGFKIIDRRHIKGRFDDVIGVLDDLI